MGFLQFLKEQEEQNSEAIIQQSLKDTGMGLDIIRQTKSLKDTSSVVYKQDGNSVKALWIMEDGPMEQDGYSEKDANKRLVDITKAFENNGGKVTKSGSIKDGDITRLKFDNFEIDITPFSLRSTQDSSGFMRKYLKFIVK
jgi:alanyl-tRNA synthetase